MPHAKPDLAEVEVLPPEKSNVQPVLHLNESEPVVRYHMAAERCGNLSIWCAAMAGAEILKKKKSLGHGNGFRAWKEKLPFSIMTAHNYEQLAKRLEEKLNALPKAELLALLPAINKSQSDVENRLSILSLPSPMDVFNSAHAQIAAIVKHITNGQTLTQLYFDWDIVAKPKLLGGYRESDKIRLTGADLEKAHAEAYWSDGLLAGLYDHGCEKQSWKYLKREKLMQLHSVFSTIYRSLNDVVTHKKG
jgi:hypothetical protein